MKTSRFVFLMLKLMGCMTAIAILCALPGMAAYALVLLFIPNMPQHLQLLFYYIPFFWMMAYTAIRFYRLRKADG